MANAPVAPSTIRSARPSRTALCFDQELQSDVSPLGAHGLAQAISRVRSVTETSMMFISNSATTRLIPAIAPKKAVMTP